jgi:hypothetical protein
MAGGANSLALEWASVTSPKRISGRPMPGAPECASWSLYCLPTGTARALAGFSKDFFWRQPRLARRPDQHQNTEKPGETGLGAVPEVIANPASPSGFFGKFFRL